MDKQVSREIVMSIIEFLRGQQRPEAGVLDEESCESVEVAIQCLETAYCVPPEPHVAIDLYSLFKSTSKPSGSCSTSTASSAEKKKEAEAFKEQGNIKMRDGKFEESLLCYNNAIKLDPDNAVYLCNRAAAHSKLSQHQKAIEDCESALRIDPNYVKAHGRKGFALSELGKHSDAAQSYRKALELEPNNEGYKNNLSVAEERSHQPAAANPFANLLSSGGGLGALAGAAQAGGMPDISGLLNNPALMNMASSLMSDPNVCNMMSSFLGGATGGQQPPAPSSATPSAPSAPNDAANPPAAGGAPQPAIHELITAGRQLAEQIQSSHPDLLEQIRNQMGGQQPPPGPPQ